MKNYVAILFILLSSTLNFAEDISEFSYPESSEISIEIKLYEISSVSCFIAGIITNNAEANLHIPRYFLPMYSDRNQFILWNIDTNTKIKYSGIMASRIGSIYDDLYELKAGESLGFSLEIFSMYDVAKFAENFSVTFDSSIEYRINGEMDFKSRSLKSNTLIIHNPYVSEYLAKEANEKLIKEEKLLNDSLINTIVVIALLSMLYCFFVIVVKLYKIIHKLFKRRKS